MQKSGGYHDSQTESFLFFFETQNFQFECSKAFKFLETNVIEPKEERQAEADF